MGSMPNGKVQTMARAEEPKGKGLAPNLDRAPILSLDKGRTSLASLLRH